MKECLSCHIIKEANDFYKAKFGKLGLQSYCKECFNDRYRRETKLDRDAALGSLVCVMCNIDKDRKEFAGRRTRLNMYKDVCRECVKLYHSDASKKRMRLRRTGVTDEQYTQQLFLQDYRCAICSKHQDDLPRALCADHDHVTGKFRGCLCDSCNHLLGNAEDSIDTLLSAIGYLHI